MNRLHLPGALALCFSATLVAQKPVDASFKADGSVKIADTSNRNALPPVMPLSESVTLSQKADGTPAWPECHDAWYGTQTIKGKKVAVVVGKSKTDSETPDLLGVDLNGDGKLTKDEQMAIEVTAQQGRGGGPGSQRTPKPVDGSFAIDGAKIPAKFSYMRMGEQAPAVSITFPSYLEATVKVGDKERIVSVLDKDMDGKFGSAGDLWVVTEPGAKQPASQYVLLPMKERSFAEGNLLTLTVTGNSIGLAATPAKGPDPKDMAAQRERAEHVWTERFDKEREGFVKAQKVDESRAKATAPIKWNYVSFDEGLAMAKKANKPLFVDVMAFWCIWCYRMDYYTYPDKQVADLLNNSFVPVKLIQEQATGDDYTKVPEMFKAHDPEHMKGGIPAMGVFTADGKVVHTIGGWSKPEKFVEELENGLKAAGTGGGK